MYKVSNREDRFAAAVSDAMIPRRERRRFDWSTVASCVLIFVCGFVAGVGAVWL